MIPVVEVRGLCFGYRPDRWAVADLNLSWRGGRRVAIVGANGAGKSTLLQLLNGGLQPCKGEVRVAGRTLGYGREDLRWLRSRVGLVVQDPDDQIIASTVEQEVAFGPLNLGLSSKECQRRVKESLEAMDCLKLLHEPVHELSFGQKKRVAIASILAMHPAVLLLDEAAAGLDHQATLSLLVALDVLAKRQGTLVVLTTHDTDLAYEWAEEVVVLDEGRRAMSGTPEEVFLHGDIVASYRLALPAVVDIWQRACSDDWCGPIPRTRAELAAGIRAFSLVPNKGIR